MKKLVKKGKRFVALVSIFTLFVSPVLVAKSPGISTQSLGDVWLIGGG